MSAKGGELTELEQENARLKERCEKLEEKQDKFEAELEEMRKRLENRVKISVNAEDDEGDDDDAEKKAKKRKSNKLADIRNKLKNGTLTRDMYDFLRTECDTKTTQNNVVKAFKIYQEEVQGKEVDDNLTFSKMLEEMKQILGI